MIAHLIVFACACALGLTDYPPAAPAYEESHQAIKDTRVILTLNILSMDGDIPLLNDSRRHYAEIIHVIHYVALMTSSCSDVDYQTNINTAAPEAISNPQVVIDEVQELIQRVEDETTDVLDLVIACTGSLKATNETCDEKVDRVVKGNPDKYQRQADVLLAAGAAADNLNGDDALFDQISNDLLAHNFVIEGEYILSNNALTLSFLYDILSDSHC